MERDGGCIRGAPREFPGGKANVGVASRGWEAWLHAINKTTDPLTPSLRRGMRRRRCGEGSESWQRARECGEGGATRKTGAVVARKTRIEEKGDRGGDPEGAYRVFRRTSSISLCEPPPILAGARATLVERLDLASQVPWPLKLCGRLHSRHATITHRRPHARFRVNKRIRH